MDGFNQVLDTLLRGWFAAFSWAPPALPLALVAAAAGAGMLWVFSRTSNQAGIRAAKRRAYASLLEMRVFADEPVISFRAQRSLLAANLRYLALSLIPAIWIALPVSVLLVHLESFYGRAPLPPETEAVVTMGMSSSWDPQSPAPQLATPAEIEIEGPPVRVVDAREVSWRIRPKTECSGELRFVIDGRQAEFPIEAGGGRRYVPGRSVRPAWQAIWYPAPRATIGPVEWLEIDYPEPALTVFGIGVNWVAWFFAVSMLSALLLRRRFGVVI
jgi:hypothetical protein